MDLSHGPDKMESSVALQMVEAMVLLKFRFCSASYSSLSKAALCVSMLFSSCVVRNRDEVSQAHCTSAVVCCQAGRCLRKMRYSQPRAPLVPRLGSFLQERREDRPSPPTTQERGSGVGGSCKGGSGSRSVPLTPGLWLSFSEILGQL